MAKRSCRVIAGSLAVSLACLGLPAPAAMVPTTMVVSDAPAIPDQKPAVPARDQVRAILIAHGVTPDDATLRVDALTDEEVARFAERFDRIPAGGEVIAVLFTVFAVLLVTDILGLTKVYPFTRPVR